VIEVEELIKVCWWVLMFIKALPNEVRCKSNVFAFK